MRPRHFVALIILLMFTHGSLFSQGPEDKSFGFGISLGYPMAGTVKYWANQRDALNLMVGSSYFGSPRFGLDYKRHFRAFDIEFFQVYAGPGLILGVGNTSPEAEDRQFHDIEESEVGVAVRAIIGFTIIPQSIPFEFFMEMGPLVGVAPEVGAAFDFGIGFRFYP